jgi:hypothetical protein
MEPTATEKHIQRTAKLFVYLYTKLALEIPAPIAAAAKDMYASSRDIEPALCKAMQALKDTNETAFDTIVYDGRIPEARDLAAWWQAHETADQQREQSLSVLETAVKKLNRAEADALGHRSLWDRLNKE